MSDIIITHQESYPHGGGFFEATSGKHTAHVSQYKNKWITVCCHNASASVRRTSIGRTFQTWDEALDGYKSASMRSIIQAARSWLNPSTSP